MAKFCRNCGTELPDGARFCEACGAKVPEEKPAKSFCTSCGKELSSDALFCPFCGAKTGGKPSVAPPSPTPSVRPSPLPNQTRQNGAPTRQTPASRDLPDYMKPGYQQRVKEERQVAKAASSVKKGGRALSFFLSVVLAAEVCVAGFKYPGFLLKDRGDSGTSVVSDTDGSHSQTTSVLAELTDYQKEIASLLGVTEKELLEAINDPIEVTVDNSPGNPAFLDLSFTEEEATAARTLTAPVSRENPTADFPEFGIHVDLKWWNLDNEEDTLIVKRMPTKTDPISGSELYTYDYSLASGQNRFSTNVAITVPIEGSEGLDNVLTVDPDTGLWKEAYYELFPDGKSYTFYMDHFTPGTAKSKTDDMLEKGLGTIKQFRYENGKSVFGYYPREGRAKYDGTSHYLYTVGIVGTPDFEKFLLNDTGRADTILEDIVTKSGGIPAEAGLSESCSSFGEYGDKASVPSTVLGFIDLPKKAEAANTGFGYALTGYGLMLLSLRVSDQYRRGVSADKIIDSNKWGAASALVSTLGSALTYGAGAAKAAGTTVAVAGVSVAAAPVLTFAATACAVVGVAIYAATKVSSDLAEEAKKKNPLGLPRTIEEGAYFYYLSEYCKQDPRFVVNVSWPTYKALVSHPGAVNKVTNVLREYHADALGNGWANGLNNVFKEYEKDPVLLEKVVEAMYEFFLMRYDMVDPEIKEQCWRESLARIMEDGSIYYYNDNATMIFGNPEEDAKSLGISMEEFRRRSNIYRDMEVNGKTVDDIFTEWKAGKYAYYPSASEWAGYENRAKEGLYRNTNEIVYNIYTTKYQEAIVDTRDKLYKEILPWMNTRITFYAHDKSVTEGVTYTSSEYYRFLSDPSAPRVSFVFNVDHNKPLFLPGNQDSETFQLYLQPNAKNPVLLETTVFHYLMWGCPTEVRIGGGAEGTALANWENVAVKVDPKATKSGLLLLLTQEAKYNIKDIKVPVEFEGKKAAKSNTYQMVLQSNSPIEYAEPPETDKNGDWFTYTPYGADNTVTVSGDQVTVSMNAINYVWRNSSFGELGESRVFTFKRDAVTVSGTLTEESAGDDYILKTYTLKNPPAISGSYKEEEDWDSSRRYYDNKYTASDWKKINSYSLTNEYIITGMPSGTVVLNYDSKGTKLLRATVTIGGSGTYSWKYDDGYLERMQGMMENGTENKGVTFIMILRASD